VVFTDNTVLGDGVNIASRLNAIASPGGVCISERVYDEIRNKPEFRVKDLGEQRLKNVSRPIRAYQIVTTGLIAQPAEPTGGRRRIALIAGAGAVILAGLIVVLVRSRSPAPAPPPPEAPSAAKHTISSIAGSDCGVCPTSWRLTRYSVSPIPTATRIRSSSASATSECFLLAELAPGSRKT